MGRNKSLAWGRLPVNMQESEMEARPLREAVSTATEAGQWLLLGEGQRRLVN